jgi:hypothetical protein
MTQANPQTSAPQVSKAAAFKKEYKLAGMVISVIVMWLDYFLIHQGLIGNDLGIVSGGMVVMLVAAAIAYYFG